MRTLCENVCKEDIYPCLTTCKLATVCAICIPVVGHCFVKDDDVSFWYICEVLTDIGWKCDFGIGVLYSRDWNNKNIIFNIKLIRIISSCFTINGQLTQDSLLHRIAVYCLFIYSNISLASLVIVVFKSFKTALEIHVFIFQPFDPLAKILIFIMIRHFHAVGTTTNYRKNNDCDHFYFTVF